MKSLSKRELFLIEVYNEYHPGRDAFNFEKSKHKERASRLLDQLRGKVVFKPHFMGNNLTKEIITGHGKYSLD